MEQMEFMKQGLHAKLKKEFENYDPKTQLLGKHIDTLKDGYHSKVCGYYHDTRDNINFAAAVLLTDCKEYEEEAKKILDIICDIQDTDPESKTFGLWAYLYEEPLPEMIAPDYNWADFFGKWLVSILIRCPEKLGEPLLSKVKIAARNAAICSIRRNVGSDYTNIALMGSLLQVTAGEILEDKEIFETGKARIKSLLEFTEYHTAFTEYNSSCYTVVAIDEVSKMLALIKDRECRAIAEKLNVYAWKQFSEHYNHAIGQLAAPELRSYQNLEFGRVSAMVHLGTGGKYGYIPEGYLLELDTLVFPPHCPEELIADFEFGNERFIAHNFFRGKTTFPMEGHSGLHSMTAYSYMTPTYNLGCLSGADLWVQRRPLMATWNAEKPAYFKLRCIRNDYDFCSGIVHTSQYKNTILAAVTFATDHGSFHFVLDENKSGIYDCSRLLFRLEIGGYTEEATIKEDGENIVISDRGTEIRIMVKEWMYDGKKAEIKIDQENKCIDFVCFDGEVRSVNLNTLKDTFGVFTITVNGETVAPVVEDAGDMLHAYLERNANVSLKCPKTPVPFEASFQAE